MAGRAARGTIEPLNHLSLASFVLFAGSASAAAQEPPPAVHDTPSSRHGVMGYDGSYLMLGPSFAAQLDRGEHASFVLGGELSFVNVSDALWIGAYLDAGHAFSVDETRVSFGPELGIRFLGLDGGYVATFGADASPQHGIAVRPMLTFGIVTAYFRSSWLLGEHADWVGELGLLLKGPILLGNEPWL
jgi:hypothetical protein